MTKKKPEKKNTFQYGDLTLESNELSMKEIISLVKELINPKPRRDYIG